MPETTISVPNPCHESWAAMTPTATGRHCGHCQENVVDFTRMSEAEVVVFLRQHPGVSCGRFRTGQLDRPLLSPARAVGGWRRWWGATLALLGLGALAGSKAQAQAVAPAYWGGPEPKNQLAPPAVKAPTDSTLAAEPAQAGRAVAPDSALITIQGVVYNAHGRPQAGIQVALLPVADDEAVATTDANGHFQFVVPKAALGEEPTVSVYQDQRFGRRYRYASADVDINSLQPYLLRLERRLRKYAVAGKFR